MHPVLARRCSISTEPLPSYFAIISVQQSTGSTSNAETSLRPFLFAKIAPRVGKKEPPYDLSHKPSLMRKLPGEGRSSFALITEKGFVEIGSKPAPPARMCGRAEHEAGLPNR